MKILIVEDSPATRDLLRRALEEGGHTITLASRYATGLRLALEGEFELAILDVMLPDGTGVDLCRTLRAAGSVVPVLFLSAKGEVGDRIEGLDAGGDDYLRKPFALAELRARVRAIGRRRGLAPLGPIQSGEVTIDFAARRMTRAGRVVTLTAREWAVLVALAERAGRVVARPEVIDAAWPSPGPGVSESLDVILSRLRRKLGEGDGPRIRTARGQGYILELPA